MKIETEIPHVKGTIPYPAAVQLQNNKLIYNCQLVWGAVCSKLHVKIFAIFFWIYVDNLLNRCLFSKLMSI